jgi:hypothetical protein
MSRSWEEVRAEAEATGKLNPRRPGRRQELLRDLDRRNAVYVEPTKDYSIHTLFVGIGLALLADAVLGALAAFLIVKAVS